MDGDLPAPPPLPDPVTVVGHALHPVDLAAATAWIRAVARAGGGRLVVTLNPEIVVQARRDAGLAAALAHADLTVADGVGIVWAARRAGLHLPGRVAGIDLAFAVLAASGADLPVYLLGGRPGVAEAAAAAAHARWGTRVVGHRHGYFDRDREGGAVAAAVRASGAGLLLAGLGEGQERFLDAHRESFGAGALIGVGGTLDVLAGVARRTPAWTQRLGVEWAWRVGLDPKRWRRAPRLARFVLLALRERPS